MMAEAPEHMRDLVEHIAAMVAGGMSIENAVAFVAKVAGMDDAAEARRHYELSVGIIRDLRDPRAVVDRGRLPAGWYAGPQSGDQYWPEVRRQLEQRLPEAALISIDASSSKITSFLQRPGSEAIDSRGLVVGHVQSGKTTSFMSVAAKAADRGYKLVIVMSGITNSLREQTQERLTEQLIGANDKVWFSLTNDTEDFRVRGNVNMLLAADTRLLAVVKKNPSRLRALKNWLLSANQDVLARCPVLLIDDEADQASIDVSSNARRSRINGLVAQLLSAPKAAYLAYTATPFANLLIDPGDLEDLYPRDFVVELPRPEGYMGPEELFGREPLDDSEAAEDLDGFNVIRTVDVDDVVALRPPRDKQARGAWSPGLPDSLCDAIDWFVLATAARRHRGTGVPHSSMLIHTTVLSQAQNRLRDPVNEYVTKLWRAVQGRDERRMPALRSAWEEERQAFDPTTVGEEAVTFDQLLPHLGGCFVTAGRSSTTTPRRTASSTARIPPRSSPSGETRSPGA